MPKGGGIQTMGFGGLPIATMNNLNTNLLACIAALNNVAGPVWAAASRTITSEVNTKTSLSLLTGSVPNGTTLDLRPAANTFRFLGISVAVSSNLYIGIYNGATSMALGIATSIANSQAAFFVGNNSVGHCIDNYSGAAATYGFAGFDQT